MDSFKEYDAKKFFTVNGWPNYITTDKRLSPKTKLILLYNKGQNPKKWIPRKKRMMEVLGIGSDNTWMKYMNELISYGYVRVQKFRKKDGTFGSGYEFCLDPAENEEFTGELPEGYYEKFEYEERKLGNYNQRKKSSTAGEQKKTNKNAKTSYNNSLSSKKKNASKDNENSKSLNLDDLTKLL